MANPRVYLTNAASLKSRGHAGGGQVWAAMVIPPWWLNARKLPDGAATPEDFEAMRLGDISIDEYFLRFQRTLAHRAVYGRLRPGALGWRDRLVRGGDTLVCTCPRPGKKDRKHKCHLEYLAPALIAAGWEVTLYGVPLEGL